MNRPASRGWQRRRHASPPPRLPATRMPCTRIAGRTWPAASRHRRQQSRGPGAPRWRGTPPPASCSRVSGRQRGPGEGGNGEGGMGGASAPAPLAAAQPCTSPHRGHPPAHQLAGLCRSGQGGTPGMPCGSTRRGAPSQYKRGLARRWQAASRCRAAQRRRRHAPPATHTRLTPPLPMLCAVCTWKYLIRRSLPSPSGPK